MNGVLGTGWSIAWSGWLANYNRTFRFSRAKIAVIWQIIVLAFMFFVSRRVRPVPDAGLQGLLVLMAVQMGWFGLLNGFSRGQAQLYQGLLVPLFQMSPARPLSLLIGRSIEAVPMRLWNGLLWAWAYSAAVPGAARWGAMLLLFVVGAGVALLSNFAGMLLVVTWAYLSPRSMRNGTVLMGIVTMFGATWAVIFLARGGNVSDLALQMRQLRTVFTWFIAIIGGLPGLVMLGSLAVRPEWLENMYRSGLYRVIELGELEDSRPSRSLWLPLPDGAVRGLLAKEWLQWYRSRMTRIQGLVWVCGTVGVFVAGQAMAGQPLTRLVQFVTALSLLAWGLAFSHWVVRVFEAERAAVILYRLAAVPAATLLWGKFLTIFLPSAVMVAISAWVGCLGARAGAGTTLAVLGWSLAALAAGTVGGFGLAAATAGQEPPEPETMAAASRMGPPPGGAGNAWYLLARMAGLLVPIFLVVWTGSGQPWLPFAVPATPLLAVDALLPLVALLGGYRLMSKGWDSGRVA